MESIATSSKQSGLRYQIVEEKYIAFMCIGDSSGGFNLGVVVRVGVSMGRHAFASCCLLQGGRSHIVIYWAPTRNLHWTRITAL